jgi:hypothetical protein
MILEVARSVEQEKLLTLGAGSVMFIHGAFHVWKCGLKTEQGI